MVRYAFQNFAPLPSILTIKVNDTDSKFLASDRPVQ